jgi:hypothetical protein
MIKEGVVVHVRWKPILSRIKGSRVKKCGRVANMGLNSNFFGFSMVVVIRFAEIRRNFSLRLFEMVWRWIEMRRNFSLSGFEKMSRKSDLGRNFCMR